MAEQGVQVHYKFGTMIEVPRAALTAGFTDARPVQQKAAAPAAKSAAAPAAKKSSPNEIRKFREHVGQLEKKVVELEAAAP